MLERTEELREAVLDLEAFNVSVSHDLRSPIGAIVNLTAVLRETNPGLDAAALELVRRIDSSALRALARDGRAARLLAVRAQAAAPRSG